MTLPRVVSILVLVVVLTAFAYLFVFPLAFGSWSSAVYIAIMLIVFGVFVVVVRKLHRDRMGSTEQR